MIGAIETRQLDDIATWMLPIQETGLPSILKGVFFMDGNPLPDTCITMYNLNWDAEKFTLFLPVYAPLQWTFHNSIQGWLLLRSAQIARFTYKIQFDDATLQRAQIIPLVLGLSIPKWIVSLTMIQTDDSSNGDTWLRRNVWLGGIPYIGEYILRRVVNADGSHTPAFKEMLNKAPKECLVVTRASVQSK
ncbi:MAG: hypothetical protein SAL70_29685 [Scytonema sp. PMC 1070.18]|nr:hypothetical protein [Scytonema sp. PMC 1070.18]